MQGCLWPAIAQIDFPDFSSVLDMERCLSVIDGSLACEKTKGIVAWNASQAAFELALIDCLLKEQNISLSKILPPKRSNVIYSGVITAGSKAKVTQIAQYFKTLGLHQIKVKVDGKSDRERLLAVREVMGDDVSIRIDANGIFSIEETIEVLKQLSGIRIDCIEQPIARGDISGLIKLKSEISIPVMADESLVTLEDAQQLISAKACSFFNLRISKCGGVCKTLRLAGLANKMGIRLQLGAQVGETAVLSAAGRHIAAYLDQLDFVEGSFGTMLLKEDIAEEQVNFGHGGKAPILDGVGLGINIREACLRKYAVEVIKCGKNG
jgi:muconate cycloisomerase